ncbi:squalene synthase HpnC [Neorhodopirellula pilleata]|uniref:All-trans-phytoene synthase n=1 Tax=Neorhodopirellula pilleata TaxID=2714738 RepID=A0A5C6AU01_9BACT|nr:squalene synthase HpnC [Neorhodopirellula pilleata]TWU01624.1 All-trans-phytoene synthase [Neorhodopirellula pilleata]
MSDHAPPPTTEQVAASSRECRRIARGHYENFLVASVLLPRSMRQPFYHLYAFCRTADDLADESPTPEAALAGIAEFREQIRRVFEGGELKGIFIALAQTVGRFDLPRKPFDDLLDAFVDDQSIHRYRDETELLNYCRRSANPVGRLVLALAAVESADCVDENNLRLSDQVCTGLQLANFWQDVARDYRIGRIYLPQTVMQRHGFDETALQSTLQHQRPTPTAVRAAIAEQCVIARNKFDSGRPLIGRVPSWLAADIELFIRGGLATLDAIERIDYDVLRKRVRVGKLRQAWLVGRVLIRKPFLPGRSTSASQLPQTMGGDV